MTLTYTFNTPAVEISKGPIIARIIRACSEAWEVDPKSMVGRRRTERICIARHAAMVLVREQQFTLTETANALGRADHGTVIHAIRAHSDRMMLPTYATRFNEVKNKI